MPFKKKETVKQVLAKESKVAKEKESFIRKQFSGKGSVIPTISPESETRKQLRSQGGKKITVESLIPGNLIVGGK